MELARGDGAAGRVTVTARGQVDIATAPRLAEAVAKALAQGVTEVVVDLAAVDFLDSAGVRALVQSARAAEQAGAALYLDGAQGWVARVLEITGVGGYLPPPPGPGRGSTASSGAAT